ncbi:MAG: hypothetical protein RL660_1459 [Bacteroidota bacterium]|jgi:hypothetical protein
MNLFSKKYFAEWLAALLTVALLVLLYQETVLQPNKYVFCATGDGLMMDYQTLWHAMYGKGLLFTGFNYPYTESIAYAGGQASLSLVLSWLRQIGIPVQAYIMPAIAYFTIALIVLGSVINVKLLRLLEVGSFWQVVGALLLTFTTPIIERLFGHQCLAYPFFFTTCLYLALAYYKRILGNGALIWLFVLMVFFGFNNAYFSAFGAILFSGAMSLLWLFDIQARSRNLALVSLSSMALLTFVMFYVNPIPDRVKHAYGFYDFSTQPLGLFVPQYRGIPNFLAKFGVPKFSNGEINTYMGFVAFVIAVIAIFRFVRRYRIGMLNALKQKYAFWTAIGLTTFGFYLLACNFIFSLNQDWFCEHFYLIFKFRTSGRLAWPFAAMLLIAAIVAIDAFRKTAMANGRNLRIAYIALVVLWLADAAYLLEHKIYKVRWLISENIFSKKTLDSLPWPTSTAYKIQDFQSITVLPTLNVWSDKMVYQPLNQDYVTQRAMQLALSSGLPMNSSMLSRISHRYALRHGQLMSHKALPRDQFADLPNTKPFLIVAGGDSTLRPEEREFLASCELIGNFQPSVNLYAYKPVHDVQYYRDSMLTLKGAAPILQDNFSHEAAQSFAIDGGSMPVEKLAQQLWQFNANTDSGIVSFWTYSNPLWFGNANVKVQVIGKADGQYYEVFSCPAQSFDNYKGWIKSTLKVPLFGANTKVKLVPFDKRFELDRLQVQSLNSTSRDTTTTGVWVDNIFCKKP